MSLPETPSQTVGPYFSIGLTWEDGAFVVPEGTEHAVWLNGRILDGEGAPIPDAVVEIFARGLLRQVLTRLYFPDEAERNAADPVLSSLDADARATLVAQPSDDGYALDIHMQGPHATAFFAF